MVVHSAVCVCMCDIWRRRERFEIAGTCLIACICYNLTDYLRIQTGAELLEVSELD